MHEHEPFTWLSKIPGLEHAPNHLVTAVLVAVLLVVCGVAATALAKAAGDTTIPEGHLSFRNFFEIVAESKSVNKEAT